MRGSTSNGHGHKSWELSPKKRYRRCHKVAPCQSFELFVTQLSSVSRLPVILLPHHHIPSTHAPTVLLQTSPPCQERIVTDLRRPVLMLQVFRRASNNSSSTTDGHSSDSPRTTGLQTTNRSTVCPKVPQLHVPLHPHHPLAQLRMQLPCRHPSSLSPLLLEQWYLWVRPLSTIPRRN